MLVILVQVLLLLVLVLQTHPVLTLIQEIKLEEEKGETVRNDIVLLISWLNIIIIVSIIITVPF